MHLRSCFQQSNYVEIQFAKALINFDGHIARLLIGFIGQ